MSRTHTVKLQKPLERAIHRGHPWLYREAFSGTPEPGDVVTVLDRRGRFLARGLFCGGPIALRLLTTTDESIDARFFARRIEAAAALREQVVPPDTDAYRLLHGEGDRLAGVVCDVYGDVAVLRFDTEAWGRHREALVASLLEVLTQRGVGTLLEKQGRGPDTRVVSHRGSVPERVVVREHGMRLVADLARGQKTGLFLDHRESRKLVRELSRGQRVLNLYGYTGGFSVAAGLGGATAVTTVDLAPAAIELANESWAENGLPIERHEGHAMDVARFLADQKPGRFDIIVADPPSFAPRERSKDKALEAYAELHGTCLKLLGTGGLYLAASCSSHVSRHDFDETLGEGARRARRVLQLLTAFGAPADHPRLTAFPEGDYLKVSLLRVID